MTYRLRRILSAWTAAWLAVTAFLAAPSCSRVPAADGSAPPESQSAGEEVQAGTETAAPEPKGPPVSDTAAFVDSTELFRMRTSRTRASAEDLSVSLYWRGVELPKAGKLYYLPVAEDFDAASLLDLSAGDGAEGLLYLDAHILDIGISPLLNHNTATEVCYCTDTEYLAAELCFTTLPVMAADISRSSLSQREKECSFSLWEAKQGRLVRTDSPATLKIRGASSASLPKTGLKLELCDEAGETRNLPLCGMRKDDDWILYASYSDNTHVRDAVGWHLWERMTAQAGLDPAGSLQARWVELILGGKYDGFYLLLEKMDEKTLGLNA